MIQQNNDKSLEFLNYCLSNLPCKIKKEIYGPYNMMYIIILKEFELDAVNKKLNFIFYCTSHGLINKTIEFKYELSISELDKYTQKTEYGILLEKIIDLIISDYINKGSFRYFEILEYITKYATKYEFDISKIYYDCENYSFVYELYFKKLSNKFNIYIEERNKLYNCKIKIITDVNAESAITFNNEFEELINFLEYRFSIFKDTTNIMLFGN